MVNIFDKCTILEEYRPLVWVYARNRGHLGDFGVIESRVAEIQIWFATFNGCENRRLCNTEDIHRSVSA